MNLRVLPILKSMGLRYVVFRAWHEFTRKTGLMKRAFPTRSDAVSISIGQFVTQAPQFLPMHSSDIPYSIEERTLLAAEQKRITNGEYPFFSGQYFSTKQNDWLTNPKNGYKYNHLTHWTDIADIDPAAGDIKFVWEQARFCWAYTLLRSDRILGTDSARFLFDSILSFINSAPNNCGPHWRCGQEIALRVVNWITILFTYRERLNILLNDSEFELIIKSIHSQIRHVFQNRRFARIAVRNNHAISEALGLYVTGFMFPWFPESKKWKEDGKYSLEKEGLFQIYSDGSYLQHSFNYQRVVLQQYSFALSLASIHGETFSSALTKRLDIMLDFMIAMQDNDSGSMPNYGANDGALFFPVGRGTYRDFRPQLDALHAILHDTHVYRPGHWYDETTWFCGQIQDKKEHETKDLGGFPDGGYYSLRGDNSFAMIRCASYKHRPSQADSLHLDIWHRGRNIIRDCGSYTYVMTDPLFSYFVGTASHNTVQIAGSDQMEKGPRFIWYNWPLMESAEVKFEDETLCFNGAVRVYQHIIPGGVLHERTIKLARHGFSIEITDHLTPNHFEAVQIWNIGEAFNEGYSLISFDVTGTIVQGNYREAHYSETYGICDTARQLIVPLRAGYLRTVIKYVERI